MKFLANENIPLGAVQWLRSQGADTIHIGTSYFGISDREVIQLANQDDRTFLTFDSDYGELIFRYGLKPSAGVVYFRLFTHQPADFVRILSSVLDLSNGGKTRINFEKMLTVIDSIDTVKLRIRQRPYS